MRLMRNVRTGRNAVYDAALIATGNWVEVVEQPAEQKKAEEPRLRMPRLKAKPASLSTGEPQK